jgi:hypothetical protein
MLPKLWSVWIALLLATSAHSGFTQTSEAPAPPAERDTGAGSGKGKYTQSLDLGTVTTGGLTINSTLMTALTEGRTATFHVTVKPLEPRPKAVRSWISVPGVKGAIKSKADLEDRKAGMYHAEPEVPAKLTDDHRLFVEVQPASGPRITVDFPVRK